jgi:hypothetical protein
MQTQPTIATPRWLCWNDRGTFASTPHDSRRTHAHRVPVVSPRKMKTYYRPNIAGLGLALTKLVTCSRVWEGASGRARPDHNCCELQAVTSQSHTMATAHAVPPAILRRLSLVAAAAALYATLCVVGLLVLRQRTAPGDCPGNEDQSPLYVHNHPKLPTCGHHNQPTAFHRCYMT